MFSPCPLERGNFRVMRVVYDLCVSKAGEPNRTSGRRQSRGRQRRADSSRASGVSLISGPSVHGGSQQVCFWPDASTWGVFGQCRVGAAARVLVSPERTRSYRLVLGYSHGPMIRSGCKAACVWQGKTPRGRHTDRTASFGLMRREVTDEAESRPRTKPAGAGPAPAARRHRRAGRCSARGTASSQP